MSIVVADVIGLKIGGHYDLSLEYQRSELKEKGQ